LKRKKFKRTVKPPAFFKNLKESLSRRAYSIAVCFISLVLIFILAKAFLYRSDYFRLRAIEVNNILPARASAPVIKYDQLLNFYKGRNIFGINLRRIAYFFREGYPDAKDVTASIILPDKIVVTVKSRWPVAVLKAEKSYPIDSEGYVLSNSYDIPSETLPVITGISQRYIDRNSKRLNVNNLKLALDLLSQIEHSRFLSKFGIVAINASEPAALSFSLSGGIEVRIGSENFAERLKVLEKTLRDPRLIPGKIDYIDLRFGDAVIGPK
jgi:cell division septal protein FtsQ